MKDIDELTNEIENVDIASQSEEETVTDTDTQEQLLAEVVVTNQILSHQYTLSLFTTGCLVATFVLYLLYRFIKLFY